MFQVATQSAPFAMHSHGHHQSSSKNVQLPRTLARPAFTDVSRDAILAVAPELSNVPTEYIRRGLRPRAPQMLAGIAALPSSHLPASMPKGSLPHSLCIPIRPTSSQPTYPTHVLAVGSSKSSSNEHAILFPIHSIVLASQCSALPRLPPSAAPSATSLTVPVLPLALPSPAAFRVIHAYLYDHSLDSIFKSLFPLPAGFVQQISHNTVQSTLASGTSLHQLSSYLCSSAGFSLQVLTTHAAHVKELWQNMVALGLNDPQLWDALDLAWEVILGAMNLAAAGH